MPSLGDMQYRRFPHRSSEIECNLCSTCIIELHSGSTPPSGILWHTAMNHHCSCLSQHCGIESFTSPTLLQWGSKQALTLHSCFSPSLVNIMVLFISLSQDYTEDPAKGGLAPYPLRASEGGYGKACEGSLIGAHT
jgi:hypothetical protein